MSTSCERKISDNFLGNGGDQGILFAFAYDETAVWADVSWLSKFAHEQEILFTPTRWSRLEAQAVSVEYEGTSGNTCCYQLARYKLSGLPGFEMAAL